MALLAVLALFIIVPLAELYVILQVGEAIGAPATIALLAADSILGWLLMRSQGRTVWRRFQAAMAEDLGRPDITGVDGPGATRPRETRPRPVPPSAREDESGKPRPLDSPFSGFVFKVQANMDPAHRDRIAFLRVCS